MDFDHLLEALGIHVPTVLDRFCGNKILLERFILKFPVEKTFAELSCAYEEQRFEDVEHGVHTLKGIAANFGFDTLQMGCADMLDDLRGPKTDLAKKFLNICVEYQRLTNCIASFIENTTAKG